MSTASNAQPPGRAGNGAGLNPHAPSTLLPLWFMLTGLLALAGGVVALVVRPAILATYHYNHAAISVTHLVVLGWICTVVMGAMYQLVPVALETKLYSERLARWQFVLHVAGFSGMVWMFWTWNLEQVGHFGSVLTIGVVLFVYNLVRTLLHVRRWNVISTAVACAPAWLSLAVLAGLTLLAGKCSYDSAPTLAPANPFGLLLRGLRMVATLPAHFDAISAMHAHAHLGAVGLFLMLMVGVSYKLAPMFTLSEVQDSRRAMASLLLLNAGLAGSFVTILFQSRLKPAFAVVVIAGLAIYGLEMAAILRARKRRALDWGVKQFLAAMALLAPLSLLALVLSWPTLPVTAFTGQLENLYGFLGLMGVISFGILGMLYKIIPFFIWYHSYSRQVGRCKVPALADLYSARVQAAGFWIYLAGLAATSVGIVLGNGLVVQCGATVLGLSLAALAKNIITMLGHLLRPAIKPLPARSGPLPTAIQRT